MARTTTRPQAPKLGAVARRRAAAKRAAYMKRTTDTDSHGNPIHLAKADLSYEAWYLSERTARRAKALSELSWIALGEQLDDMSYEADDEQCDWNAYWESAYDALEELLALEDQLLDAIIGPSFDEYDEMTTNHNPEWCSSDYDAWDEPSEEDDVDDQDGYSKYRGIAIVNAGFNPDAVFGEGYLGGNCGWHVTSL